MTKTSLSSNHNIAKPYKDSGVDIKAGRDFVKKLSPFLKPSQLTQFAAVFDLKQSGFKDPLLLAATDGVGTKLLLAQTPQSLKAIGQDLVAMSVNDLTAQGAQALFFLDYIACHQLDKEKFLAIIEGISTACAQSDCQLIGGETAEMPALYQKNHYDLAGFAVGAVERDQLLPKPCAQEGDIVLGLASHGVHSNGFSLVRKILDSAKTVFDKKILLEKLLQPTRLYASPIRKALERSASIDNGAIIGIAHITGGGLYENLPRALPQKELAIALDATKWTGNGIFGFLQKQGDLSNEDMFHIFNCGIGMALIVNQNHAQLIKTILEDEGEIVFEIGQIVKREPHHDPITIQGFPSWRDDD